MSRGRLTASALVAGSVIGASAIAVVLRPSTRLAPELPQAVHPVVTTGAVDAYQAEEENWRRRALGSGAAIAVGVGLFIMLAFVLENVASGPEPLDGSSAQTFAALRSDALVRLSQGDGLMLMLTLLTAEAALAIALSATDIDPSATPHVAVSTERWLDALSASVRLLAVGACLIAVGTIIEMIRDRTLPDGAVLILMVAMIAAVLAAAMVDRSSALLGQIGVSARLSRVESALERLASVPGGRSIPLFWVGLPPVAVVLGWAAILEAMASGLAEGARQTAASVALVGCLAFGLAWARRGLASHAITWSYGRRWSTARLLVGSLGIVLMFGAGWGGLALLLALAYAPGSWLLVIVIMLVLMSPIVCLAYDGIPRPRLAKVDGPGSGLRITPSCTAAQGSTARLERNREVLTANLDEHQTRARQAPLLARVAH